MSHVPRVPQFLSAGLKETHAPSFGRGGGGARSPDWARPKASAAPAEPVPAAAPPAPVAAPATTGAAPAAVSLDERVESRILELGQTAQLLESQAQADALEVGMLVARRLLERELESSALALEGLVKVALKRVGEAKKVTVRLAPRDHLRLKELKGFDGERLALVADPKLEPGDVVVETETQTFDGRLSTRLEELERELRAQVVEPHE